MDFTIKPTNSTPELTSEVAQTIYAEIIEHGNADLAFKAQVDSAYEPEHFKLVDKEIDKLFSDMNRYSSGNVLVEPEVNHIDEITGEIIIDSPANYYILTTETDFKKQFSSDYLDISVVYGDWKGDKTWTEIKEGN